MDRKRLILLGSMAVLGMVLFAACSSTSMESLQQFRFSDFVASLQTESAGRLRPRRKPWSRHPGADASAAASTQTAGAGEAATPAEETAVFFVSPGDGATVTSPFEVEMGASGLTVEAAGEIHEGAGHMHILVDEEFVDPGEVVLTTDTMIHFGQGQLATTLDLEPGEHTLRLQFANGAHIALDGDQYRDEITVVVAEPGEEEMTAAEPSEAAVFFVAPLDGATVTSPFEVEMGASGLIVEAAGQIREGAGHMHILVDEEFVYPGEVVLSTDTMIHFGQGQLATTLDLEPGEHTLRLQFANGAHFALDGDQYHDEITVVVAESGEELTAAEPSEASVFFVSPGDGATVTSPFEVEMGASGLIGRGSRPDS